MTEQPRDERQLMRQRGAAAREIPDADLDLDFHAGTRQERQLMRQRGAGNREVDDIHFSFAFNTPSTVGPRRSRTRSRTPGTVGTHASKTIRTAARLENDPPEQDFGTSRTARNRRLPSVEVHDEGLRLPQPSQRKRRRLSELTNTTRATSVEYPLALMSANAIEEEDPEPQRHGYEPSQDIPSSPLFFPNGKLHELSRPDKENELSTTHLTKPATKKRKRKSIGQQSLFKKKRKSGSLTKPLPTPPPTQNEPLQPLEIPSQTAGPSRKHRRWSVDSAEPEAGPSPHRAGLSQITPDTSIERNRPQLDPTPKLNLPTAKSTAKPRKKRKSIVQGKKKRRSTGTTIPTPPQVVESIEEDHEDEVSPEDEEELNELSFEAADADFHIGDRPRPTAGRKVELPASTTRTALPPEQEQENDNDADETYLPDDVTPEPTPARKHAKGRHQQRRSRPRPGSINAHQRPRPSKSAIPILTHRATNLRTLPTISELPDLEAADSADELTRAPPAITTRTAPNAVDVLAQACREYIDTTIDSFSTSAQTQTLSRAAINKRISALQSFKDTLDTTFFHSSQCLDARLTLEARLRKSRREKADLQARWLEIRKARDRLDLRKDAIRREHWEKERLGRMKFEISEGAWRVERLLENDGDAPRDEEMDLEVILREVANDVSDANESGQGGVLMRLKSFNDTLERLASQIS